MPKTVLLTGATGFLGSHILDRLIHEGYHVVILKRSFSDTWRINHLMGLLKWYNIDEETLDKPFEEQKIDVVIHTATMYGRKGEKTSEIVAFNVLFSLKLLETAISFNVDTFFNTDTLQQKYLSEYTLSKKQFAEWLKTHSESGKIKAVNMKVEHMYGPKDDRKKFVIWLMEQMLSDNKEIQLTSGNQKRDFVFIDDVVQAFLLVLNQSHCLPHFNEFDIGTGEQIRVREFVLSLKDTIEAIRGIPIIPELNFGALPYRIGEVMDVVEDVKHIANLGWKPTINLSKGLELIVQDYLERCGSNLI